MDRVTDEVTEHFSHRSSRINFKEGKKAPGSELFVDPQILTAKIDSFWVTHKSLRDPWVQGFLCGNPVDFW